MDNRASFPKWLWRRVRERIGAAELMTIPIAGGLIAAIVIGVLAQL